MTALTRREFLQLAAASSLGVTVLGGPVRTASAARRAAGVGILIDVARCIGCRTCEAACKAAHGFPEGESADLGPQTWTYVKAVRLRTPREHASLGADGAGTRSYKVQCMHCVEPACASACPVGALRKTADGPVEYDAGRCIGCRYCMIACPFQVPRFEWRKALPAISKCNMCADRRAAGKGPACVEACPLEALQFGPRDHLLAEAARRIAADRSRYVPAIYGAEEAGGTSVMYISDVPFEELGFPVVTREPLPSYTWRVLGKLPGLVIGLGATLTAVEAVIRKRMEMQTGEEREDA
ncbi:MAG TPA: 4Fe-4S dicluster domain-containing protein [Gemmatimonadales bacterium]|nr:4Fe-4S dicluster domain-containing protein [Gemmatimonadales bacterium]